MDWNKGLSYDRFLDIHVFNKDSYDWDAESERRYFGEY